MDRRAEVLHWHETTADGRRVVGKDGEFGRPELLAIELSLEDGFVEADRAVEVPDWYFEPDYAALPLLFFRCHVVRLRGRS